MALYQAGLGRTTSIDDIDSGSLNHIDALHFESWVLDQRQILPFNVF